VKSEVSFDSIESAHAFITLLIQVVVETKCNLEADIQRETGGNFPRRLKALQIIEHKLRTLECHLENLGRILNDLRSLRRLLLEKRATAAALVRGASIGIEDAETARPVPSSEVSRPGVPLETAAARLASTSPAARKRALSSGYNSHAHDSGVANAVPWYVRPDCTAIDGRKSRETSLQS